MSLSRTILDAWPTIESRSIAQIEREIIDELEFHIAMRTEENMSHGMSPDAARAAAIAKFGDFAAVQRRCRLALLGARIMWQRIQMILSVVLLGAVVLLAFQFYNGQRANQAAIDDITSALKQFAPVPAVSAVVVNNDQKADETPTEVEGPRKTYPIKLNAKDLRQFKSLSINFGKLKLSGESISVMPISTEVGVTGAVLIGNGTYTYTPETGKQFNGHFRAAMLRFNPKDADAIIKLSAGKATADKGTVALARAVLGAAFSHCWHSGSEALIPPERAISADLFSREIGDVLFSGDDNTAVVYNFTDRKSLYEKN
ncbi:MAG TPA: permease prefix domain 1-containing protein [Lacipirellulaceae bacterium]|nr:permease prefix domain 1-containing protein [Lacipirellulaceae bacterium]